MPLFACTIFLSAALLFLMQPLVGKMLLPRLGGTPAVWNTCMVFFQACLLAGYAYAHFVPRWLGERRQALVHVVVLGLPFLCLPLALRSAGHQADSSHPIAWLLLTLTLSAGLPFFVVATTAPLLQKWYAASDEKRDPYFLYAASNAGSLLVLLAYPLVIEPNLRVILQTRIWTIGYAALSLMTIACAVVRWRATSSTPALETGDAQVIAWRLRLRWIALALVPSSYLLGVTTFITSDIAAVPLLWIVPLALYLLSFVLVFSTRQIVPHRMLLIILPAMALATAFLLLLRIAQPLWLMLTVHLATFFVAAMVCHGELAASRPPASRLTDFYLMMSVGGVLGGVCNALIAPILFTRPLEYPLAIVLACLLIPRRKPGVTRFDFLLPAVVGLSAWMAVFANRRVTSSDQAILVLVLLGIAGALCISFIMRPMRFALGVAGLLAVYAFVQIDRAQVHDVHRSFFGIHRVVRSANGPFNELYHGTTLHGRQQIDKSGHPAAPDSALAYYHRTGPVGQLLAGLPPQQGDDIAVVGLGVGALAAYARPDSRLTFYEIDPTVHEIAGDARYFSFLSGRNVQTILGDARLTLAEAPSHSVDVIVLDAFSGDAVPIHLLTREALELYLDKLNEGGVLAVHLSNIYLDLEPVVANLAIDAGCRCFTQFDAAEDQERLAEGKLPSTWAIVTKSDAVIATLRQSTQWEERAPEPSVALWTDDFSNVLQVCRWWRPPHER